MGAWAALSQPQIAVEKTEGEPAYDQKQQQLGEQLTGEDDLVPDLLKPPPVHQEAEQGGDKEQNGEPGDDQQQDDAACRHVHSSVTAIRAGRQRAMPGQSPADPPTTRPAGPFRPMLGQRAAESGSR